jgi:hypothetical protein
MGIGLKSIIKLTQGIQHKQGLMKKVAEVSISLDKKAKENKSGGLFGGGSKKRDTFFGN